MKISGIFPKFLAVLGLAVALAGCGVNAIPTKDEAVKAALGRRAGRLSAPQRPDSQSGRHGAGLCRAGKNGADRK